MSGDKFIRQGKADVPSMASIFANFFSENDLVPVPGYERLQEVLVAAYDQAARGKGQERHANNLPFHEQPMQQIADRRGIGFILGQADKKSEEAQGMLDRGEVEACVRELLGSIVYLAGAVIYIRRKQGEQLAKL